MRFDELYEILIDRVSDAGSLLEIAKGLQDSFQNLARVTKLSSHFVKKIPKIHTRFIE